MNDAKFEINRFCDAILQYVPRSYPYPQPGTQARLRLRNHSCARQGKTWQGMCVRVCGCRVVFDKWDGRRLYFTCFHPEVAVALHLKQAM
jgi:hypothetical protein